MTESHLDRALSSDRTLALINYGLLFAGVFFVGVPALIAVIIAYSQRTDAAPPLRGHYTFQIRIFWIAFALTVIGALCIGAAMAVSLSDLITFGFSDRWDVWDALSLDAADIRISPAIIAGVFGGGLLLAVSALWLLIAPVFGFIRLASQQRIGEQAA